MAKRHSHYRDTNRSHKRGGFKGKKKSTRGGKKRTDAKYEKSDPFRKGIPLGGGDLNNPDLSDLDDGFGRRYISPSDVENYYFKGSNKEKSMKMGGLRPGHRNEPFLDANAAERLSFRKRPMQFIKAKELYDPSHDLIEQLRKRNQHNMNDAETSSDSDMQDHNNLKLELQSFSNDNIKIDAANENETRKTDNISTRTDNELFYYDMVGESCNLQPKKVIIHDKKYDDSISDHRNLATEYDPTVTVGKIQLNTTKDANGNTNTKLPYIDNNSENPYGRYISSVLGRVINCSDEESEEAELISEDWSEIGEDINEDSSEEENDMEMDIITVPEKHTDGRNNEKAEKLNNLIEAPQESRKIMISNESDMVYNKTTPNYGFKEPHSPSPHLSKNMETLTIEEETIDMEVKTGPEFGFIEDDYIVDTTQVSVTNMRLGLSDNSYYVKSFRLFSDYESRWVSQDVFTDFVLEEIGLPHHRLPAYLEFIKSSIIPKEEPEEEEIPDIPFSDTSEEEEEISDEPYSFKDSLTSDMTEGLDDLIQYTERYNYSRNLEYETKSIPVSGKGMKKKLLIDDSLALSTESLATLQDKFRNRLENKAKKRRTKNDFIDIEHEKSDDLFKKYPLGLHVQNIKDEFELFLKRNKECLLFPPLDPHGNKTVMKFAQHYQMKSFKQGRGNKTHIMAQKTRKTGRNFPSYHLIDQLIKQRPIFMRIDVNRSSDSVAPISSREKPKGRFHTIEGEIVGKDAPEIGQENIGRRMLQKLGWVDGEGLGAHGNKGISEPLMATVKKSKSGLRHAAERG